MTEEIPFCLGGLRNFAFIIEDLLIYNLESLGQSALESYLHATIGKEFPPIIIALIPIYKSCRFFHDAFES